MKINKSMEIAEFALAQGRYLTARDMWDLGFRFSRGETTPDNISAVLNKIHESDRIVAKRQAPGVPGVQSPSLPCAGD